MSDNKLPTSSGWYTARWDGENQWTVTYFDRGHGEVCKATVKGAPEWLPSCVVVEWGECVLPTCSDSTAPNWTAAIADARRTLTHPTDYSVSMRNMARCILAAHEERERDRISAESLDRADAEAAVERERVQRALDDGARVEYQHWSFGGIYHGATLPARPETAEARPPVRGDDETASPPFILTPEEAKDIRAHYTAKHEAAIRADERAATVREAIGAVSAIREIFQREKAHGIVGALVAAEYQIKTLATPTISVVDFAERVAAWVTPDETGTSPAYSEWFRDEQCGRPVPPAYMPWLAAQILAAARGERSLP